MAILKYPYTNLHELNLDWIIEQLNNQDGPVRSVNGKSGIVTLTGEDIVRSSSNPETVATALNTQGTSIQTVRNQIGVTPLPTTAQTLTGAIAENAQEIADVEDNVIGSTALPTTAQTLTGAIAENAQTISNVEDNVIGNTPMGTTATTVTGAIAEHEDDITTLSGQVNNVTTGSITVNSTKVTSGTMDVSNCRKVGKIVNVAGRIHTITDGTVTATGVFFNIPDGFRPAVTTYGYAYLNIDGNALPVFATIDSNGDVSINYSGSKYTTQAYFFACYAV